MPCRPTKFEETAGAEPGQEQAAPLPRFDDAEPQSDEEGTSEPGEINVQMYDESFDGVFGEDAVLEEANLDGSGLSTNAPGDVVQTKVQIGTRVQLKARTRQI